MSEEQQHANNPGLWIVKVTIGRGEPGEQRMTRATVASSPEEAIRNLAPDLLVEHNGLTIHLLPERIATAKDGAGKEWSVQLVTCKERPVSGVEYNWSHKNATGTTVWSARSPSGLALLGLC